MQSLSYFFGIVKVLENPNHRVFNDKITTTNFRVLMPQIRKTKPSKVISLTFWGPLARDVQNYYKVNDYILIEGYVSIKIKKSMDSIIPNSKNLIINVLKVYPFLLK